MVAKSTKKYASKKPAGSSRTGATLHKKADKKRVSQNKMSLIPHWNYRAIGIGLVRLSLVGIVAAAGWLLWPTINRPVTAVEFSGSVTRVDQQAMRTVVSENLGSGLFTLDISTLSDALKKVDWVYAVEVKKVWPAKLEIEIEEQQPVAKWGDTGYLAASGVIVNSESYTDLDSLPSLNVELADPQEALELFYGLNTAMMTTGFALSELNQSEFGSWSMTMENGSKIMLGKEALLIRMHRVMHAWQRLVPQHIDEIESVDARYPNGLAVKYRQEVVQQNTQQIRGSNI